jgi:hypothetical protein
MERISVYYFARSAAMDRLVDVQGRVWNFAGGGLRQQLHQLGLDFVAATVSLEEV